MIIPFFHACSSAATEAFIFGNRELATSLVRHSQDEAASAGVGPVSKALVSRPYVNTFTLLCAEVREVEQGSPGNLADCAELGLDCSSGDDWVLLLAPGVGPVTSGRIASLVELIERGVHADVLVSAMPVIANCNPAWLNAMRREYVADNKATIDDFHRDFSFPFTVGNCRMAFGVQDAAASRPLGSQWLPDLYHQDGAVMAVRASAIGSLSSETECQIVPARPETGLPLLYRMPFFQMDHTLPIQWEITEEAVKALLAPAPERSGAAYAKAN